MKKKTAKESPRIYRRITDSFKKTSKKYPGLLKKVKMQSLVTIYLVMFLAILILGFDLVNNIQKQKEINYQREKI